MSFGAQWAQKVTQKGKNVFYNFVLGVWRGAAGRSSILGGTTQPPREKPNFKHVFSTFW